MTQSLDVDLSSRICIITGANTGIGKEVTRGLARGRAQIIMACRDEARGQAAQKEVAAATGNNRVEVMTVDLSSQSSIRQFAKDFTDRHKQLHVLVNNAGIWPKERERSVDGIEKTWATNVLGYYLLTLLLLDRLKASAPSRIINVASDLARDLDLDDVQFERRSFSGMTAYAQSKQADRMLTWALAERLAGTGVTANAAHPGFVNTELFRKQGGLVGTAISQSARFFARKPEKGAETIVWAAAAPELEKVTGKFFVDRREQPCNYRAPDAVEKLWNLCAQMTQTASEAQAASKK